MALKYAHHFFASLTSIVTSPFTLAYVYTVVLQSSHHATSIVSIFVHGSGVPEFWIRELGGWGKNSQAYLTYLRLTPFEKRAEMTTFLTRSYVPKSDELTNYWDRAQRRIEVSSAMEVPALAPEATAAPAAGAHPNTRGRMHATPADER